MEAALGLRGPFKGDLGVVEGCNGIQGSRLWRLEASVIRIMENPMAIGLMIQGSGFRA